MKPVADFFQRCLPVILILSVGISFSFVPSARTKGNDQPVIINLLSYLTLQIHPSYPEPLGDFNSLTVPLKRAGRLLLIEAVIDGVKGNLVFDTGATGLVLNKTYFRNHPTFESGPSNGITGSAATIGYTNVGKVEITDLHYEKIIADVADLGHIENQRGSKIIGLFGFNMIKSFEIVIDAGRNELQLHRVDKNGARLQKPSDELVQDHIQKIEPMRPVLILKGNIGGKTLNFCLDTGAETNAINSHAPKKVLNTISITRRSDLRGSGQAINEVLFGIMNDFSLDEIPLKEMETIVVNLDALSEVYGVHIDGILGYGFLEKGIITINLAKKQFGIRYANKTES